jgi:hypothetical protein
MACDRMLTKNLPVLASKEESFPHSTSLAS